MDTDMDPATSALQVLPPPCLSSGHYVFSMQWHDSRANGHEWQLFEPRATHTELWLHGRRGYKGEETVLSHTVVSEDWQERQSEGDPGDEEQLQ